MSGAVASLKCAMTLSCDVELTATVAGAGVAVTESKVTVPLRRLMRLQVNITLPSGMLTQVPLTVFPLNSSFMMVQALTAIFAL